MTTDDILRMAIDAGAEEYGPLTRNWTFKQHHLERFAALVAAAEREECAKVAKDISDKYAFGHYGNEVDTADEIEAAIRARGTK